MLHLIIRNFNICAKNYLSLCGETALVVLVVVRVQQVELRHPAN
jgi:tartrate dehydratase alpha subunit/fumarate hydratase class I-like protein